MKRQAGQAADVTKQAISLVVVEDDELGRTLLRRFFEARGYFVQTAGSGAELGAVLRCHEHRPDAYLLDLQLPDCCGFDLIETIRRTDEDAIIVVLSGVFTGEQHAAACYDGGAVAHFGKPADEAQIARTFESRVLQRRRRPTIVGRGSVRLRMDGIRTLYVAGQSIALGPKEYVVLRELARRRGRPMSKEDLRRLGQGHADTGSSRAIDVMMSALRAKLGEYASVLVTVPGGYSLDLDYGPLVPNAADRPLRPSGVRRAARAIPDAADGSDTLEPPRATGDRSSRG